MKRIFLCWVLWAAASWADQVNYTYDKAGRLVRVDYDSGTSIVYEYDQAGNLLRRTVAVADKRQPSSADRKPRGKRTAR